MENLTEKLSSKFGQDIVEITNPRPARIYMRVKNESFKGILKSLINDFGLTHLSTISAVDLKTEFEVVYHLFGNNIALSIAIKADRNDPHIDTITDIIPGAIVYERELQEMMGIEVNNIPDGRRLIIPEDWPKDQFPLRKDWSMDMLPDSFNDGLLRKWQD